MIFRLVNEVRPYPWGSTTALPELLGVPATGEPQAELWLGAHPSAPSRIEGDGTLLERLRADPEHELGSASVQKFGVRLPYLMKILAAEKPLSLQAHPTLPQARDGHAREEAAGVPLDAPHRNYKDASHKPEVIVALTPFRALGGFRPLSSTFSFWGSLGCLDRELDVLRTEGLAGLVPALLTSATAELVAEVAAACAQDGPYPADRAVGVDLAAAYPGDPGVLVALLLNHVELAPGEALFMPAGNLHMYLSGVGVEIMANSDNVLRGGLTPKHVDVPELSRVLDFADGPPPLVLPTPGRSGETVYAAPVEEFLLTRHDLTGAPATVDGGAPQILLCVEGAAEASTADGAALTLSRGQSAYLPAAEKKLTLAGSGTLFRATVNL